MTEIKEIIKKIKEKKDNFFFSKLDGLVSSYWDKWFSITKEGYDVTIKNAEDIKTEVDFSSLKFPTSFKIDNAKEISEYIVIPKNEKFPGEIKVSNLKELSKIIEIKEVVFPKEFSIKNLKEIPTIDFPENLKKLSLKKTEEVLTKLTKELAKKEKKSDVFITNKKPTEYIPVRMVDKRGKDWLESFGSALMGFPNKIGLFNTNGETIDPSTETKQDDIITAVNNISGLQRSTDLQGLGDITVGLTQVAITITGTPESIRMRADTSNTGIIFIGKTGVLADGSNDFVRLESGDEIVMSYDDTTNALYAISDTAGQLVNVGVLL